MNMFGALGNLSGVVGAAKRIVDSGLGLVQSRVELLSTELQEERVRTFRMILVAAALVATGMLAVGLFTATIIFAFGENLRLYALGGLTAVYSVAAIVLYRRLYRQLRDFRPLSGTIEELQRDREALNSGNGTHSRR